MGHSVSSARAMLSSPPPWKRPHQPARISILSFQDLPSRRDILQYLASHDPDRPVVVDEIPSIGFHLERLRCDRLTLTASASLGSSQPKKSWDFQVDWMRTNTDGVVLLVDCRIREFWEDMRWDLAKLVLRTDELRRCPLLVLAVHVDADGAMGLDEVEHDIRTPMEGYHQQLPGGATSFVDAYPGLEESERPFSVKKIDASTGEGILEGMEWMVEALNSCRIVEEGGALH